MWLCAFLSYQTKTDQEEEEVDIATCSRGQYFGELALVTNKPRAASAYAVGNVKCLGILYAFQWSFNCIIFSSTYIFQDTIYYFTLLYIAFLKLCQTLLFFCRVFLFQSWMLKPSRDCWVRAWTSWRETLLTTKSNWLPCLEVALRSSNRVHETAPMDQELVDERKGFYVCFPP